MVILDRGTLLEHAAACSRLIEIASDADQRFLLESVQDMWKSVAYECDRLSRHALMDLIGIITALQVDIETMERLTLH